MTFFAQTDLRRPSGCAQTAVLALLASLAGLEPAGSAPAPNRQAAGLAAVSNGAGALIRVSRVSLEIEDVEAESGQDVPLRLALPSVAELERADSGEGSFILVRNIPAGISLSAGMPTGRVWVVPLRDAAQLRLISTPQTAGDFRLEFYVIGTGNRILAEKAVSVTLRQPKRVGTVGTVQSGARGEAPSPPAPPEAPRLSAAEEATLLARGEEVLRQGGIAAARLIFEELARSGSSKGAFALARSHDPAYVSGAPGASVAPDLDKALRWYRRAAELGSIEARNRLAEIAPGR